MLRALAVFVKSPPGRRNRDLRTVAKTPRAAHAVFKRALVICCLIAPLAIVPIATANAGTASASDNFARANGSLGPNWTNMADGGLTIVNQQVQGTNSGGDSGDIRTAETYSSDQSSQVQLTSTQLTGNQWVGPAVRAQAGGPTFTSASTSGTSAAPS